MCLYVCEDDFFFYIFFVRAFCVSFSFIFCCCSIFLLEIVGFLWPMRWHSFYVNLYTDSFYFGLTLLFLVGEMVNVEEMSNIKYYVLSVLPVKTTLRGSILIFNMHVDRIWCGSRRSHSSISISQNTERQILDIFVSQANV